MWYAARCVAPTCSFCCMNTSKSEGHAFSTLRRGGVADCLRTYARCFIHRFRELTVDETSIPLVNSEMPLLANRDRC